MTEDYSGRLKTKIDRSLQINVVNSAFHRKGFAYDTGIVYLYLRKNMRAYFQVSTHLEIYKNALMYVSSFFQDLPEIYMFAVSVSVYVDMTW